MTTAMLEPPAAGPENLTEWRRDVSGVDPASVDLSSEEWKAFELVDGELRERDMGFESEEIAIEVGAVVRDYVRGKGLGRLAGSNTVYRCFENPKTFRKPDVSFVSLETLGGERPRGECRFVPDLVVEVTSPNEKQWETVEKVEDFLSAGTRLVWVIDPHNRVAMVYRQDGTVGRVVDGGELSGEDVLPGFSVALAAVLDPEP